MAEQVVDNPYGLGALIAQGDIVARSTLVILVVMSLLTWFIMITKFFDQGKLKNMASEAEREFWGATSLPDAINKLKGDANPFRNGLTLIGVSSVYQILVTGILVILAVATDQMSRKGAR